LVPSKERKKDGKVHGEVEPGVEDPIEPSTGRRHPRLSLHGRLQFY
jgi:hypothetical protein